jgi:hypothetical protein
LQGRLPRRIGNRGQVYYHLDFEVAIRFGATSPEARILWKEDVCHHCLHYTVLWHLHFFRARQLAMKQLLFLWCWHRNLYSDQIMCSSVCFSYLVFITCEHFIWYSKTNQIICYKFPFHVILITIYCIHLAYCTYPYQFTNMFHIAITIYIVGIRWSRLFSLT